MFSELVKVNEINLESVPEVVWGNWLDRPLNLCCDWIFLQAHEAGHAVMLDMVLSDIPILGVAVFPCPFLTKVTTMLMPLIDCIKKFLPGYNYLAWLSQVGSLLLGLKPSHTCHGSASPGAQTPSREYWWMYLFPSMFLLWKLRSLFFSLSSSILQI